MRDRMNSQLPSASNSESFEKSKGQEAPNAQNKPSFASLFKDNRCPIDHKWLDYVPFTGGKFRLDFSEIDMVEQAFGHCLIGCILDNNPNAYLLRGLDKGWGVNVKFQIHGSGWIIFSFDNAEQRDRILHGGPYMIFARKLYLKERPRCFYFQESDMSFMPVWIQRHELQADCWTHMALSHIASIIGKPIYTEKMTHYRGGINYARVFIEVNTEIDRTEFNISLPTEENVLIRIVYEGASCHCVRCGKIGHLARNCKSIGGDKTVDLADNGQPNGNNRQRLKNKGDDQRVGRSRSSSYRAPQKPLRVEEPREPGHI